MINLVISSLQEGLWLRVKVPASALGYMCMHACILTRLGVPLDLEHMIRKGGAKGEFRVKGGLGLGRYCLLHLQ